jgi:hypothetical protein
MMRSTILHTTRRFEVRSYGNGLAYSLRRRPDNLSVLFQGDDADTFRNELDVLTEPGKLDYDNALGVLWEDYCAVATEEAA